MTDTVTLAITVDHRMTRAERDALVVAVASMAAVADGHVELVPDPTYGPVESSYRTWIRGLGRLSPRQEAVAEQVYAVAANLDTARSNGTPAAAVASLSRALFKAADALPAERAEGAPRPTGPVDKVDEVARARQARRAKRGAGGTA